MRSQNYISKDNDYYYFEYMNEFLKFWSNAQSSTKILDNPFHKASTYLKTN